MTRALPIQKWSKQTTISPHVCKCLALVTWVVIYRWAEIQKHMTLTGWDIIFTSIPEKNPIRAFNDGRFVKHDSLEVGNCGIFRFAPMTSKSESSQQTSNLT